MYQRVSLSIYNCEHTRMFNVQMLGQTTIYHCLLLLAFFSPPFRHTRIIKTDETVFYLRNEVVFNKENKFYRDLVIINVRK